MTASALVIAEHDDSVLLDTTARTVSAAGRIAPERVDIVVFADTTTNVARQAAHLSGVTRVLTVEDSANAAPTAVDLEAQLASLVTQRGYTHVLGPSTTFGKDVMPRLAAALGSPMVSDIARIHDGYTFVRPIYAGNAFVTITAPSATVVTASIRCASFDSAASSGNAEIETVSTEAKHSASTRILERQPSSGARPSLQSAERVVVGGRGVGSAGNFEIIYDFADSIGAAVGASRAAVDAGYAPNELQVGQTGRIISPTLYFGFGISGAIQHLAGIKDAGTIVAINTDPDAPIFEIADIGLVGDLFEVIPELKTRFGTVINSVC